MNKIIGGVVVATTLAQIAVVSVYFLSIYTRRKAVSILNANSTKKDK